ncbi:hypothetical protein COY95_00140, partial [Candidatus Woesearchaeota archaeon CG_4_10_14_0_8_um_filter_47_5]
GLSAGDTLTLLSPNGKIIASAYINGSYADGNNRTLEYDPSTNNGAYRESRVEGGTPGAANSWLIPAPVLPVPDQPDNTSPDNTSHENATDTPTDIPVLPTSPLAFLYSPSLNRTFYPNATSILATLNATIHELYVYFDSYGTSFNDSDNTSASCEITVSYSIDAPEKNRTLIENTTSLTMASLPENLRFTFTSPGTYRMCYNLTASGCAWNAWNKSQLPESYPESDGENTTCFDVHVLDFSSIPPFPPPSVLCNVSLEVLVPRLSYRDGEKVEYSFSLSNRSIPFSIEYWIEDAFGNVVKTALVTENLNPKSWTPRIDAFEESYLINARLSTTACNTIAGTSEAQAIFVVTRERAEKSSIVIAASSFDAADSSADSAVFGDETSVTLEVYKGNTLKRTVYAWVEDANAKKVSSVAKASFPSSYTNSTIILTLTLKDDCTLASGEYFLHVEGLDQEEQTSVYVSQKTCPDDKKTTTSSQTSSQKSTASKNTTSSLSPGKLPVASPDTANTGARGKNVSSLNLNPVSQDTPLSNRTTSPYTPDDSLLKKNASRPVPVSFADTSLAGQVVYESSSSAVRRLTPTIVLFLSAGLNVVLIIGRALNRF